MKYLIIAAIAAVLAVVQASFLAALPFPASALSIPLLLVVALVASFRFREALVAAAAAGAAADALSSMPLGVHLISNLLVSLLLIGLFNRVFTNHSWPGVIGLNAAGFILLRACLAAFGAIRAVLYGYSVRDLYFTTEIAAAFGLALGLQLAASIVAVLVARQFMRRLSSVFIIR